MPSRRSVFLWMLCFTLPAVAEQSSTVPKLTESIEVSIVNLDVFVTDKHGAPVHGLTRVDFEIFENRVRQPITNFTEYSSLPPIESASAVESPTSTPPNQPRTILLFVDRLYLPKIKADPFFEALRSTLNNGVRPGDEFEPVSRATAAWALGLGPRPAEDRAV